RLLADGIRVERCVDLALCGTILRGAAATAHTRLHGAPPPWAEHVPSGQQSDDAVLFSLDEPAAASTDADELQELRAQVHAVAAVSDARTVSRLRLLLAAESAGSLVAAELRHAGLPWRDDVHDRLLTQLLGPRDPLGRRPQRMEQLVAQIRSELDAPALNPDSPSELMKALQRAG